MSVGLEVIWQCGGLPGAIQCCDVAVLAVHVVL